MSAWDDLSDKGKIWVLASVLAQAREGVAVVTQVHDLLIAKLGYNAPLPPDKEWTRQRRPFGDWTLEAWANRANTLDITYRLVAPDGTYVQWGS